MLRRLYFVIPSVATVTTIINELKQAGVDARHLSVATLKAELSRQLGVRVRTDLSDRGALLERVLWTTNLILFLLATLAAVALALSYGFTAWLLAPVSIMFATFIAGLRFTHIPNAHIQDFADALRHNELLLMVDVPPRRVHEIEELVHQHPDATVGGVGWASELLRV